MDPRVSRGLATLRTVEPSLVLVTAALAVAATLRLPLAWDGSYYLFRLLTDGQSFNAHNRLIGAALQFPAGVAAAVDAAPRTVEIVFGLSYASVPAASLFASWWLARERRPEVFWWSAVGIGMLSFPGAAFMVNDASQAIYLAWPVVLWIGLGLPAAAAPVAWLAIVGIFFAHPAAIGLLAGFAVAATTVAITTPARRRVAVLWGVAFAAASGVALARLTVSATDYEQYQASIDVLLSQLGAIAGLPSVALICIAAGSLLVLVRRWVPSGTPRLVVGVIAVGSFATAAVVATAWASQPAGWRFGLEYRAWIFIFPVPFMAAAFAEAALIPAGRIAGELVLRRIVAVIAGLTLFGVLVMQSISWFALTEHLRSQLDGPFGACVEHASLEWVGPTALNHWGLTPLSLLLAGREPRSMVLASSPCVPDVIRYGIPIGGFQVVPWDTEWFEWDTLRDRVRAEFPLPVE